MGKYKGFQGSGMNTNKNMNSVMKQAQKMQEEMERVQAELEDKTVEATAGGGVIEVVANGKKELVSIKIKPEAVDPDDVEMLQDTIIAAVNEAMRNADSDASNNMSRLTGGLNLSGLF